jgi:hypothetical protein
VAVRAGGEQLGSIWVVGGRAALSAGADDALMRVVPAVARGLLRQQRFTSRSRDSRAALLRKLLTVPGHGDLDIGEWPVSGAVVVGVRQDAPETDRDLLDTRLADLLSLHAHRLNGTGLAAALDEAVYTVLPWVDRAHLEERLRPTLGRVPSVSQTAVSGVVHDAGELPAAARSVGRLLELMSVGAGSVIGYVDDARHQLVLAAIGNAITDTVPEFRDGLAARIRQFDDEHRTHYEATLRAWFEANGDVTSGAKRIHVHPNTFRYRIARATEIFELDFDDPDERLLLHLQLRVGES